jgi:hypothetical protein
MKKLILIALCICVSCYAESETQPQKESVTYKTVTEKREALWKDFHKVRFDKYGKFQDIRIYAEDESLTKICYISEDGLFIYRWDKSPGEIERVIHAKKIMYDKINRITFDKPSPENHGSFILWYYGTCELVIGG